MKPRKTFLLMALGVAVGLIACQDQGVVAPDDVISPDDAVALFGKPECPNDPSLPWPKCDDDGGGDTGGNTASLTISGGMKGGMDGGGDGLEVVADNGNILSIRAPKDLRAWLYNSWEAFDAAEGPAQGQWGDCRAKPAYTSRETVLALANQLFNNRYGDGIVGQIMDGSKVEIKKKAIGNPSDGHFIGLNYDSPDPLLKRIFLRVGAGALFDDYDPSVYDGPLTTVEDLGGGKYLFSGGTVWVGAQIGAIKDRPFLECPLAEGDEVTVWIER